MKRLRKEEMTEENIMVMNKIRNHRAKNFSKNPVTYTDKEAEEYQPLPSFLQEVEAFQLPGVGAYAAPDLNFTRIQQSLIQLKHIL